MRPSLSVLHFRRKLMMVTVLLMAVPASAEPLSPKSELQCILVEKARIAHRSLKREREFGHANYGHQILRGNRKVLAIRFFDDPDHGPDSQTFQKATLELEQFRELNVGEELSVRAQRSHYSKGATGWVADGEYWWAKDPFPRISLRRELNGLRATLIHTIRLNHANGASSRGPQLVTVNFTCMVRKLPLVRLTPWTGRPGTEWRSFHSQGVAE